MAQRQSDCYKLVCPAHLPVCALFQEPENGYRKFQDQKPDVAAVLNMGNYQFQSDFAGFQKANWYCDNSGHSYRLPGPLVETLLLYFLATSSLSD